MCLRLHIVFTPADTSHVQYLHTLTSLSPITQMGRARRADGRETGGRSAQFVALAPRLPSLCTLKCRGGRPAYPPRDKESDSAAFVPGVA